MSNASRLPRGVRLVPAAAPAGRAFVKLPPAYTVLPTMACDQTTPSTWTVGSASAVTALAGRGARGAAAAEATPLECPTAAAPSTTAAVTSIDRRLIMRSPRMRSP